MYYRIIASLFFVFTFYVFSLSYAEIDGTISEFEESNVVNKFSFVDRSAKILNTSEKAYLYKNKDGHLIEIILNKENKIRTQSLATYATKSGSQMKIVALSLISEFINEASRGQIDYQQFNKILNAGLNERKSEEQLSGFNVEIILTELWGEYEGIGLLTVTITKSPE